MNCPVCQKKIKQISLGSDQWACYNPCLLSVFENKGDKNFRIVFRENRTVNAEVIDVNSLDEFSRMINLQVFK